MNASESVPFVWPVVVLTAKKLYCLEASDLPNEISELFDPEPDVIVESAPQ